MEGFITFLSVYQGEECTPGIHHTSTPLHLRQTLFPLNVFFSVANPSSALNFFRMRTPSRKLKNFVIFLISCLLSLDPAD
jgi:hypothetical protein